MVIWLIGLSGVVTTLAKKLLRINMTGSKTILIDGDIIREDV